MTKKERAALALERKILRAIESGEFTPDYGYLSDKAYVTPLGGVTRTVLLGPCGCALAAAGSVNGIKAAYAGHYELREYLKQTGTLGVRDSEALENGYESNPTRSKSPYFFVGQRLRRFHPGNASAE
jgi:hypothetical protein